MTEPDRSPPGDELAQRYREASAQDTRRPGAHVRDAVRAHAQMVIAAGRQAPAAAAPARPPAANQSRWKISAVAGLALAGLTGLLVLQYDRGTDEDKDLAFGQPSASKPPVTAPAPPLPAAPAAGTPQPAPPDSPGAKAGPAESVPPAPKAPAKPAAAKPAPPPSATGPAAPGGQTVPPPVKSANPSPAAPPPAAPVQETVPRSRSAGLGDAAPERPAAPTRSLGAEAADTPRLAGALQDASRAGDLPQLERLLRQGAALNAADAAGRTPLILAAMHGHAAVVRRLLAAGANKSLIDRDGLNALQHARRLGFDGIAHLIEAAR